MSQPEALQLQQQEYPRFMRVDEVAELMGISESCAYKIMRKLNKELEQKGKITTAGRVSRRYLLERVYC